VSEAEPLDAAAHWSAVPFAMKQWFADPCSMALFETTAWWRTNAPEADRAATRRRREATAAMFDDIRREFRSNR
jgi:hypothetical protein